MKYTMNPGPAKLCGSRSTTQKLAVQGEKRTALLHFRQRVASFLIFQIVAESHIFVCYLWPPALLHFVSLSLPSPCLTVSLPHGLPASLPPCLTASLPHCLPASLSPCPTASLPHCLPASLPPCLTVSLHPCLTTPLPYCLTSHQPSS
jgi:hypothetical protein